MDLCYYNSERGNFGDDLNPYILNHFLEDYEKSDDGTILFFIGTILAREFIKNRGHLINDFDKRQKIIFGSGVRFLNKPIKLDDKWDIKFLRGPLSSLSLKNDCSSFITDPAYLIREVPFFKSLVSKPKKYKLSLMPHFLSVDKLNWNELCAERNINFINPSEKNVEIILSEIAQSEMIVTEAMHGAIVADAFRIPWKRFNFFSHFNETDLVSEVKWSDWLFSVKLDHETSFLKYPGIMKRIDRRFNVPFFKNMRYMYIKESLDSLIKDGDYQISKDSVLNEKMEELMTEMDLLRKQIGF